jgi:hypothetical protein
MEDRKRNDRIIQKMQEEGDRREKEGDRREKEAERREKEAERSRKEAERSRKEAERSRKENDRIMKELSLQMGGLHRSFGELAEHLVAPGIVSRFNEIGYHFDNSARQRIEIFDEGGKKILTEIDLLLENGECLMAVEIKSSPAEKDIAHHIWRLELLRDRWEKLRREPKRIRGGIVGAVFPQTLKEAVIEAGLYVIEQSGDTMRISVPEGFKPREW